MSERTSNRIFDIVNISFITLFVIFCLAPFLHTIAISFSSNRAITSGEVTIFPKEFNWDAYIQVFSDQSMIYSLGYTTVLTIATTVLCMVFTLAAAYPLTKKKLKGRKLFMYVIIITMFFSGGIIPEYLLIRDLNLLNSVWALILPGLVSPFNLIILISFFRGIPESLEESAEIDGSSHVHTLFKIILPLSMPVLATLALFYAVGRWNGFQDSLMYINDPKLYPLQLKLFQMVQNNMVSELTQMEGANRTPLTPESLKAATVIFATVPILLVYPWLQKYFVSGAMLGAVKG
ncbi:carbohydrate ABC transporter permease [Paenibacillus sp. FSL H7-0942]|jgi:putative aldouronate transport system permease protein|uniref:Aldouronate transport system permease protein n=2 Tax=Paenibacillus TaxID=44249 RepID=A0ABS4RWY4_PAEXY|nr:MULTISPECIES: carbohydrate ABC transporter permease [Paenibacillus]ETT29694.1 binding-protein-dependent transport systems inner membrane component [Paenibacillus sp. FSL R5-192]ETT43025.1 binding-protein-dependent transport systems inner membrane component [Paenibacillus sp. FSL H7-689]KLU56864.1 ABC transporter permease [Paenibacillus sp. VT-400]MBP2247398.1 putative aldouronate transport system permease protein [Paenibacillus xylanexedens]MCF7758303.1 carbohydrate ABC transporter permease